MNQLQIFKNSDFGEIRTVTIENEPWFAATDVCKILELSNPTVVVSRLDEDEVTKLNLGGLSGETNVVNEFGLYSLILGSRKHEARQFKRWITHDVIPTIRKHGAYMSDSILEQAVSNPDFMIGLLENLKEEKAKRELAELENTKNKPKVLMAETLLASEESKDVGILSTKLQEIGIKNMGRNKLFAYFRDNGYVIKIGERRNLPTQRSIDLKIMEVDIRPYFKGEEICYDSKTKITPKGLEYFINKLGGETI